MINVMNSLAQEVRSELHATRSALEKRIDDIQRDVNIKMAGQSGPIETLENKVNDVETKLLDMFSSYTGMEVNNMKDKLKEETVHLNEKTNFLQQ